MAALKQIGRSLWEKIFPYEIHWGVEQASDGLSGPEWRASSEGNYPREIRTRTTGSEKKDKETGSSGTPISQQ
jgi:hypothetical protein